ncbi:hypothetical protein H6P81_010854 [Aristolochia fimbriata]|uniref:Cytochrome P450 n=1 Tax=Aristolochia fimbriata TaxID=158543 RepID=A0AAV7EQK7_ARIFI|nr:hypothetical protein H6P81_010854 [Aristolochia fimbriata]
MFQKEILRKEIVRLCFQFSIPRRALSLVQAVKEDPSLCLQQNLLIRHLLDQGLYEDVLSLYRKLNDLYCGSDNYTYPSVIKACTFLSATQTGKEIHCNIFRNGYESNVVIQTALLDLYAKNRNMEAACKVFDGISKRDLVCWNALLSGYSSNGLDQKALEIYYEIRRRGLKPNLITFLSTVPVCTRLGAFEVGKSIHGLGVKFGLSSDESSLPALISMYSIFEDLSSARMLFGLSAAKSVAIWNSMISASTQNKDGDEAFQLFQQMLRSHIRPDLVTFVSVLPSCDVLVNVGKSIHACTIKHGFEHQTSVATGLISMYTKLGGLEAAKFLFDQMSSKNQLSWNSILCGYVKNGFPELGLDALCEMQLQGLRPDSVSIIGALSACGELKDMLLGRAAHGYALRNGYNRNINILNALLHFYTDSDWFSYCLKLFNVMPQKNVISWNTLIGGAVRNYDIATAITFLYEMQQKNMKFDLVTVITILPKFYQSNDLILGMSIHGMMLKMGFESDVSLVNALISMYCNCGNLENAQLLFNVMPVKSIVTWNALMTGYRYCNSNAEVVNIFNQMNIEGEKPNDVTLLNIIPTCQSEIQGQSIHAYAIRTGFILYPSLVTTLISMYDGFENLKPCLLLFEESEKQKVAVWNALMTVLVRNKHARKSCFCFCEMLLEGVEPDSVTMLCLIQASMQLGSLYLAKSIMGFVVSKGLGSEVFVANALIDLYSRSGDLLMAREIFDRMRVKDVASWSVIINAYGIHGFGDEALNLFSVMELYGYKPDDISFIGVLSACSHSGLVEEGRKLFKCMTEKYKVSPRMEHYACMVDLLARAGYLDEALEFVKQLPTKPSVSMVESLTGACRVHGNTALREEIAGLVTELEPKSSDSYAILSSVYAAAGRWSDVFRHRSDMGGRGLTKVPGLRNVESNVYIAEEQIDFLSEAVAPGQLEYAYSELGVFDVCVAALGGALERIRVSHLVPSVFSGFLTVAEMDFWVDLATLLFLGSTLIFLLIFTTKRQKHPWPPGPRKLPIIGNLHQLQKGGRLVHFNLAEIAKQHGQIMTVWFGNKPTIVVSDYGSAWEVLVTKSSDFASRSMPYSSRFTTAEWRTLSTSDFSDAWYNLRKGAQASFFNPATVLAQTPFQESDVEQLVRSIGKEAAENNGVVNPLPHIRRNVIRLIGRLCFGPDFRDEKFVEAMDVMIEETIRQTGIKGLADLLPVLRYIPGFNQPYREIYKVKQRIEELISPCLDQYSSSSSSKRNYSHYLQFLLSQGFPQEEVVIFNIFEMFLLAVDSTSLTIAWALAFLIHDQHIQDKLYKELISLEYYGKEGALGMEQVSKMKYLQGVVKESTRMRPIAPLGIPHKALNDTSLMGERIEAGTTVMVNLYAVLHDPAVWKEPDRFDPERFLENASGTPQGKLGDDEEKDHAAMIGAMERSFLPFGAGRRNCAGMELAKSHVALTLGNLVKAFQWSAAIEGELPDLRSRSIRKITQAISSLSSPSLKSGRWDGEGERFAPEFKQEDRVEASSKSKREEN